MNGTMIPLSELCRELSISTATGRNWLRLGRLTPACKIKRTVYFTEEYVAKLKADIQNGQNTALKCRRNKKYVSGNHIYRSYVTENAGNLPVIQALLDRIERQQIAVTEELLLVLAADCAFQLILSRTSPSDTPANLPHYLKGTHKGNPFLFLVDDLLDGISSPFTIAESVPELFSFHYIYEEHEDILGLLYLSLKNIRSRKATGSYYTPTAVVKKLCSRLFAINPAAGKTVLDPCCGTGNFILQLPETVSFDHVFGYDIDEISVKIARINYALKYRIHDAAVLYQQIRTQDFLFSEDRTQYDYMIGNPPWGYVFSENQKAFLREKYITATGSAIESYDVFIEQAFRNLKPGGVLSFVLPEAVLNVRSHMPVRNLMLANASFQYLEFLGNAFDHVQCPCVILQILSTGRPFCSIGMTVNDGQREFTIRKNRTVHAECLSFGMNDEEYSIWNKLETVEQKVTLSGHAVFALGIVTGNNKKYISSGKQPGTEMILKGSDLCRYRFHSADRHIVFTPEVFQQTAPTEYYRAEEKLLYRFICSQLVFAYDNHQTLSLNSCNILIPRIEGLDIKYIMSILNSRAAQFYFRKQFHSVKVLRSHIEQIPIPYRNGETQREIVSMTDAILYASDSGTIPGLYEKIDAKIAGLYGLTEDEYRLICASMEGENLFLD